MRATKGQWTKVTGGDSGAYFNGSRWVPFECIGCMIAKGLVKPVDRINLTLAAHNSLKNRANDSEYIRHDKSIHNAWLKAGKPYNK